MLANWVKQATATTGTGTITLGSAETSYITFGDQFNDGDVVYYSIEDGNDREIGIGTYTASGTTLSRDTVLETLVSGTFDNTSPTAITLTGSAIVSISGLAGTQHGSFLDTIVSASNTYHIPDNHISHGGNIVSGTADLLRYIPGRLDRLTKITKLVWKVETADAGTTNLRLGIYTNDGGVPLNLIADSGDQSGTAASTGLKTMTLSAPIFLPPGDYWFAVVSDSTTLGIAGSGTTRAGGIGPIHIFDNERRTHLTEGGITGALPASAGSVSIANGDKWVGLGWQ